MIIRPARAGDAAEIAEIYNRAITTSVATWRYEPVSIEERSEWLRSHRALVAEIDGTVAGFAGYSQFRPAVGYQYTVENSVYIRDEYQGCGHASSLMAELIDAATAENLHVMVACVESGNMASIALHEKLGFRRVGQLPQVGYKNDRFLDLTLLQLML